MDPLQTTSTTDTQSLFDEALRQQQAERFENADRLYRQILLAEPHHADSLHMLGMIAYKTGRLTAAAALLRQAISVTDKRPDFHNHLANVLKDEGKLDDAVQRYGYALGLKPDFAEAHYNLGCALHAQGKLEEACAAYGRALALYPRLAAASINLGNATKDLGRVEEAIGHYEHALALEPDNANAHYNLATLLKDEDRFEEAIEHYRRALSLNSDHVIAHNNLGVLLRDRGELGDALRHFQSALSIKADHAESHINEAMTLLLLGRLAEGWNKYEWRWRMKGARPPPSGKPLWDGSELRGKTILLRCEQGLGDCLQFIRYAPLVRDRGGRVVLVAPRALVRLFQTMEAVEQVAAEGDAEPDHDCQISLMSLPLLFGTTLETIPNTVPYLHPPTVEVAAWARRLEGVKGLKVGLVWAGNSRPGHPAAHAVDRRRSMRLAQFAPLADIPGVQFISLQKGDPAQQRETPSGFSLIDYMDEVKDFADTAALVANLDLIIGVDTSVVHLAGALGKPVWVLSRFDGCWRWLTERRDSPWYPSLRLFRQPRMGDWASVIEEVRVELGGLGVSS